MRFFQIQCIRDRRNSYAGYGVFKWMRIEQFGSVSMVEFRIEEA